jgi:Arc/MetJ-type ribon-helix-helix transcriptional regulator
MIFLFMPRLAPSHLSLDTGISSRSPTGVGQLQLIALQCNTKGDIDMERQLTMRLPADLANKLERSARRLKRKRSEVVRDALEQYLDSEPETRPIERVRDLLGSVASGKPDLGRRHREYLIGRLRRGR